MARMQKFVVLGAAFLAIAASSAPPSHAQVTPPGATSEPESRTRIIIDTDIGDDIDDAFAVGLALNSHELQIEGITTTWGDTALRARLVQRLLAETGHAGIPIAVGIPTKSKVPFTQARWAESGPALQAHPQAVDFLLNQIRQNPGKITLVAIGPLTNIGAAIDRDAATFRKLKRVVLMGGSIRRGYDDLGYEPDRGPSAEYNIVSDIPAARKLFRSGVPIFMMPLDSTQLKLDEVKRAILFRQGTPLTDALTLLYHQWDQQTPTLFDVMTVAYVLEPKLCPTTPLHVEIDENGFTKVSAGTPNVSVCLSSDPDEFFHFVLPRLMKSPNVSPGPQNPLSSPAH
jgi:inosine-uridine nucleoside N-ribohydrolase